MLSSVTLTTIECQPRYCSSVGVKERVEPEREMNGIVDYSVKMCESGKSASETPREQVFVFFS